MSTFGHDLGTRAVTRRAFLRAGLLVAGGVGLGACSRSTHPPQTGSLFPGGRDLVAGRAQRFTFALVTPGGDRVDGEVDLRILGTQRWLPATGRWFGTVEAGAPAGYHVVELPALDPGIVDLEARALGWGLTATTTLDILPEATAPDLGSAPPALATPTRDHPQGYERLCTRTPGCGLHRTSLDEALGREPLVLVVGSPLLCESRTCGPVLDEVRSLVGETPRRRFLHVEPYTELNTISLAPIMRRWSLPSEPWVFVLDDAGAVTARFEGPVNAEELRAAIA